MDSKDETHTVQLSLPSVLVCCQGGSLRNAELLQQPKVCLGVGGLKSPQLIPSLAARPCFPRLRILSTGTLAGKRARNTSEMLLPGKPGFLQIKG